MTATPTAPCALDRLFAALRRSPVTRSPHRKLGGVCAGIAQGLGISPGIVRVATVVLAVLGPAVALYLLAWLLLPDAHGRIHLERAIREGHGGSIALLVVSVLAIVSDGAGHHPAGWLWIGLLVAALVVGRAQGRRCATPTAAPPTATGPPSTATPPPPAPMWGPVPTHPAGPQDAPRF